MNAPATAGAQQPSTDGAGRAALDPTRVFLRPVGTPVVIGLGAICIGTVMLSALQFGWLTTTQEQRTVAYVALGAAFPLELIAAIFALLARDALDRHRSRRVLQRVVGHRPHAVDRPTRRHERRARVFLLIGAALLLLLRLSAGRSRMGLGALIASGFARLAVTGLYEINASNALKKAAAILG